MTDPRIAQLVAHFQEVERTSMRDVPILNPRLQVAAIGFRAWQQGSLGVLLTPWFMNLVWLPDVEAAFTPASNSLVLQLPAGDYECHANQAAILGYFYSCSLFSPVLEFADQASAVLTAQHVMQAILESPAAPVMSRRDFLRGKRASR